MKVLFFGDIVGRPGREAIKKILPEWKKKYQPDLIMANGENLAHGKGVTKKSLEEVLEAGIDLVTSGNHICQQKEALALLEDKELPLLRPANWGVGLAGQGQKIISLRTKKILVINLIGRVFFHRQYDDPFRIVDQILDELAEEVDGIVIDWHTEATSEKMALGWYLDGRVSTVLGTHTHIPTADARLLPQGTAYISDIGMVGVRDSILGMDKEIALKGFLFQLPQKLEVAQGPVEVNAVLVDINSRNKAKSIEKLQVVIDI